MSKNGLILLTPTSIAYTGTSATISANGSVSFSAVSSLSLNGVFSADYDNYMIATHLKSTSGSNIAGRLRASGTDNTTGYTRQYIDVDGTSVVGQRASTSYFNSLVYSYNNQKSGSIIYIYGPYLAQPTALRTVIVSDASNASMTDVAGTHSVSTAYDGITFYAGTSTGRVAVYGMRK